MSHIEIQIKGYWKHIETAPKEITILIYSDYLKEYNVGFFNTGKNRWESEGSKYILNPTHWMPLPKRPKEET